MDRTSRSQYAGLVMALLCLAAAVAVHFTENVPLPGWAYLRHISEMVLIVGVSVGVSRWTRTPPRPPDTVESVVARVEARRAQEAERAARASSSPGQRESPNAR